MRVGFNSTSMTGLGPMTRLRTFVLYRVETQQGVVVSIDQPEMVENNRWIHRMSLKPKRKVCKPSVLPTPSRRPRSMRSPTDPATSCCRPYPPSPRTQDGNRWTKLALLHRTETGHRYGWHTHNLLDPHHSGTDGPRLGQILVRVPPGSGKE